MTLVIEVEGERITVELPPRSGAGRIAVGSRGIHCDCVRLPDGTYSIILDGRVFDVAANLNGRSCAVSTRDGRVAVDIHDPRRLESRTPSEAARSGPTSLQADMPGKVVRILVSEGDAVEYEQSLLVIEAMKMQNEIRSPKRGVIRQIGVREGATVNAGCFLISLE